MAIEKYFLQEMADAVFDPVPSYDGDWTFEPENLLKNSKKENGKNLFAQFLQKTYYEPINQIFNYPQILNIPVEFICSANDNNFGRHLKYSKIAFYEFLIRFLNQNIDKHGKSNESFNAFIESLIKVLEKSNDEANNFYAEALREKCEKLKDLMEKEINSEYFDDGMKDYELYKPFLEFKDFVKLSYDFAYSLQKGLPSLGDFFDKSIDINEFYKCFLSDTFYLLFAKIIYENNIKKEKEEGILDNTYSYLVKYSNALEDVIINDKNYNPKILYTLPSRKKVRYGIKKFQEEFAGLMKRHPEAKPIILTNLGKENIEKYKDINLIKKVTSLYEDETQVNWQFLKRDESIKTHHLNQKIDHKNIRKKSKEELIEEVNMRIEILNNSGFIGNAMRGLNTFSGYFAFVYPNGKVILEKFWSDDNDLEPAIFDATYVMYIDNFIEMSKMTQINLTEYMSALPNNSVKRIYHTSINNWQRNLYNEINGTYDLEAAINFINK